MGSPEPGHPSTPVQTFRERLPASVLRQHVMCVWIQHVSPESAPYTHRTIPNGSAELICELGSPPRVVGPQTRPVQQILSPGTTVVGIRFRPGAVSSLLAVPAFELVDLSVAAEDLWDAVAGELGERVAGSASSTEAAAILENKALALLPRASTLDTITLEAVRRLVPRVTDDVASLASSLDISERQLRRRFHVAIGLAPKVFHRMLRFQRFLALSRELERPSTKIGWLAANAGYADQAHLTRESMRLSGLSPRTLLREAEHNCLCAHDHAASYRPLLPLTASQFDRRSFE
jgi:AraC-like DNA-binding protein